MQDTVITKNKSISIKFIAVILMVLLHTFAFPDRIKNVEYISMFSIGGQHIEVLIGRFGSICVGMFLFLSGYGVYKSYNKNITYRGILKRIYNLYLNYWIVFFMFIPLGIFMNRYVFNAKQFILTFIGLGDSYNGEWWFLKLYIMLLLLYPVLIKIINKYNKNIILIISFLMNIGGYGLTKIVGEVGIKSSIFSLLLLILGGQFLFILGVIVAKYGEFSRVKERVLVGKKCYIFSLFVIIGLITFIV